MPLHMHFVSRQRPAMQLPMLWWCRGTRAPRPRRARLTCLGDVQDLIAGWTDVSSRSPWSSLRSHAVFCGFSQTHTKPLMDLSLSLFETHRTVIAIARYGTVGQSDAMSFRRNSHRWRGHCLTSGGWTRNLSALVQKAVAPGQFWRQRRHLHRRKDGLQASDWHPTKIITSVKQHLNRF